MTATSGIPEPPEPPELDDDDPLFELHLRVEDALYSIPRYFESETTLEGIEAQDLFSLNSVLGSTIEVQVVNALNLVRDTWDPPKPQSTVGQYAQYGFV